MPWSIAAPWVSPLCATIEASLSKAVHEAAGRATAPPLGLEAQRTAVADFLNGGNWRLAEGWAERSVGMWWACLGALNQRPVFFDSKGRRARATNIILAVIAFAATSGLGIVGLGLF